MQPTGLSVHIPGYLFLLPGSSFSEPRRQIPAPQKCKESLSHRTARRTSSHRHTVHVRHSVSYIYPGLPLSCGWSRGTQISVCSARSLLYSDWAVCWLLPLTADRRYRKAATGGFPYRWQPLRSDPLPSASPVRWKPYPHHPWSRSYISYRYKEQKSAVYDIRSGQCVLPWYHRSGSRWAWKLHRYHRPSVQQPRWHPYLSGHTACQSSLLHLCSRYKR